MRLPKITLITLAMAIAAAAVPGLDEALEWRSGGSPLQWLTCHFSHWNIDHLAWDGLVYLVLGGAVELGSRQRFVAVTLLSCLVIGAFLEVPGQELASYRGLSGLDCGYFAALLVERLVRARDGSWVREGALPAVLLVGFMAKTSFEIITGHTFFVDSNEVFVAVPGAHLAGALVGAIVTLGGLAAAPDQ